MIWRRELPRPARRLTGSGVAAASCSGPYQRLLKSKVADLVNAPSAPYAGAIAAALFLEHFAGDGPWVHFDIMAWNLTTRPAHPEGGEAMGLRAVYGVLAERFGTA